MANAEQLKALVKSHIERDDRHFYSVAMQVAARELGHALGKRKTLVALEPAALDGNGSNKSSKESIK